MRRPNEAPAKPSPIDLVGPIAEYKLYVKEEVDVLVAETRKLTDAVKAGKLAEAQKALCARPSHYERIEPIAELFNDLDGSMDSREDDLEKKEDRPEIHRLPSDRKRPVRPSNRRLGWRPIADKLVADVIELQKRIDASPSPPDKMVGGAAALIEEVAAKKITGEEDRYSRSDLWDFQANVDGAQKIVDPPRSADAEAGSSR